MLSSWDRRLRLTSTSVKTGRSVLALMVGFSSSGLRDGKISYILRSPEKRHRGGVSSLALSRGGASVFSAGRDGTVREWNVVPTSKRDCPDAPYADISSVHVAENAHKTFDEHVDWVNDIVFLQGGERLVSCSSDTTVKVWNTARTDSSLRTLTEHTDYVKALSCVPANRVASASLDGSVIVWDLTMGRVQMRCGGELDGKPPSSIYCLSGSTECHTIVAGSTDRSVSVYDLRTGERVVSLRGHTDSVRCVVFKHDGSAMLSGSTDTTVRYWDLRMERCIRSFDSYTSDSIWSLTADRDFSTFLSGGRDGTVWQYCSQTELASNIVDRADADPRSNMVLDLAMTEDKSAVWVSTTGSTIRLWSLPGDTSANGNDGRKIGVGSNSVDEDQADKADLIENRNPLFELRGLPGIIAYKILNDRRHVLTCDANKEYGIWNITQGKFLKSLGVLKPEDGHDIDTVSKANDVEVSIPSWFNVDIRLGSLTIHLVKKYVFSAEIYAVDAGLEADTEEIKVNIGEHVIRGLFKKWLKEYKETLVDSADEGYMNGNKDAGSDDLGAESRTQVAKGHNLPPYEFPGHVPVIVTEGSSPVPVLLKHVGLFEGNEEKKIPNWVVELVRDNRTPTRSVEKMAFSLQPVENSDLPPLQTTALNAPRVLRVRKVASYIAEHLPDETSIDDQEIEILCNGQSILPQTSLATVKEFVWKSPDDLKLNYRRRSVAQPTTR